MISRIHELTELINKYRDAYYNKNQSLISDEEYDKLYDELDELTRKYQNDFVDAVDFLTAREALDKVGYEVVSELPTVKHNHPMLSLDKTKLVEDLIKFAGNQSIVIMPKMDGLTCTLRYVNGKLESAITRGNGETGELITHNARAMASIPNEINTLSPEVIIDGELMITYKDFNRVNQELLDAGVPENELFANPRSMASGTARQLDSSICVHRNLKFVAWKYYRGSDTNSFVNRSCELTDFGFERVPVHWTYDLTSDNINLIIEKIQEWARDNDYKIDGAVVGYDNIAYGESLGFTRHHPRNQIAFKFYDEKYPTILRDVKWTMGKTGVITPTAIFDPVEIDGTTVSQASMHNITIMKELKAQFGATCYVYKANMIIPQIESFDSEYFNIDIPTCCPECGSPTHIFKENNTEVLRCLAVGCKGKMLKKLEAFVGKSGMDIDGLGGATLEMFYDKGWIRCFRDIYNLERDYGTRIPYLPGWQEKSAKKLFDSIEKSRNVRLDKFISALSITNVSSGTAKVIAEYFDYDDRIFFENIRFHTEEVAADWEMIPGIGTKTAKDIRRWYQDNNFDLWALVDHINFVKPKRNESNKKSSPEVCEKTFCITGTFNESRDVLKEKIEDLGGIFVSGVSKNTDILFVGDKAGSKLEKAKKFGITIYNEEDLVRILNEINS